MKKMYIVAGHGGTGKNGYDPGAVANDTTEAEVAEKIAKQLVIRLRENGADAILVPTGFTLEKKIHWVSNNTQAGDYLVSLHMNAAADPRATGAEGYYFNGSQLSEDTCLRFMRTYIDNMPLRLRRIAGDTSTRHGQLGIIRNTPPLALLIEMGFLTNESDLDIVNEQAVDALEKSCMQMLGLSIPKRNVSDWAQEAVDKAIKKKIAVYWDKPQEIVANYVVEHAFKNAGIISNVTGEGLTKERFMVILDRLRKKKEGEKGLLD